jgi:hypothetical protein
MVQQSPASFPVSLSNGPRSHRLSLPKSQDSRIEGHIRTAAGGQKPGDIATFPFNRKIDVWFAAICWAVHHKLKPVTHDKGGGFVSLGPNTNDIKTNRWQEEILSALAVDYYGSDEEKKFTDPKEIVDLANGFAASGIGPLLDALEPYLAMGYAPLYSAVMMCSEALEDSEA